MAAALAAGALACAWAPPAAAAPSVTVAVLPQRATVDDLAQAGGLSLGVMSAGIGDVPAEQTYLDISQGNRVDDALYGGGLPALTPFGGQVPDWDEIAARARDVPADLEPGLLASTLQLAGLPATADARLLAPALIAADRHGFIRRAPLSRCLRRRCPGLSVVAATVGQLSALARTLRGEDLLIAIAEPPPESSTLPIGIAGRGFDGDLTSDSTRTDGYVLSTDLAPTILSRFGLPIPGAMEGEAVRAEGAVDPGAVVDRAKRMTAVADRRVAVLVGCLAAWLIAALTAALLAPGSRCGAAAWLGVTVAYLPPALLATAAVQPGAVAEALMVGIGAAVLAAVTLSLARGWWAAAVACAVATIAYAIDVIAGSQLTALSLLGPNPVFGVRFYGIGNELEALCAVMVPVGVGAALSGFADAGRPASRRAGVAAFLIAGGLAALVFATGRFGADVGAAIVLPVGAAAAGVSLAWTDAGGRRWRVAAVVIAAPLAGLAALALIDLLSGGDAHLTRSVLDAGGAGDLADVAERRLSLSAHDFAQAAGNPLFWTVVAGIAVGLARRRRIDAWLRRAPQARAGLIGACAGVAAGVLVNDSGATFLVLGAIALGAALAFAWARTPDTGKPV